MSIDPLKLRDLLAQNGPMIRVVVADVKGSAPREVGASMVVWRSGQSGTIGGGELEWQAAKEARRAISAASTPMLRHYPLGPSLGQCCGGAVSLGYELIDDNSLHTIESKRVFARPLNGPSQSLAVKRLVQRARDQGDIPAPQLKDGWMVEPVAAPKTPLWIYGAGHVGRALVSVTASLPNFKITWVDTTLERFPSTIPPGVTALPAPAPENAVILADKSAQHLVLTYSHQIDLSLCHAILNHGHGGLGLIGSKTKWARFRSRLAELGHSFDAIDQINCPIGDVTLGKHPQAIAIGVAAALVKGAATHEKNNRERSCDGGNARVNAGRKRATAN